ncbi:MAG: BPSL0067 family protein [Acidobacteria bacterium]|nr:BPSL0067 family protein [Acidobacteriota bacterium]
MDKYGSENETDSDYRPQPQLGNGSCAVLPQMLLPGKLGKVSTWVQGEGLYDADGNQNANIKRGTVIATFNDDGRYGPPGTRKTNQNHDNHAAIF